MPVSSNNPHRSLLYLAKKNLTRCRRKIVGFANKVSPSITVVDDPVLEEIFKKVNLNDRIRMRKISSHIGSLVDRMPLILPFVLIRSDRRGNYELHCDHMNLLVDHIISDLPGYKFFGDGISFSHSDAQTVIKTIISRISGITQLWLDTAWNGHIIQTIIDYYRAINEYGKNKRFYIEQLTVVGSVRNYEMESVSYLILLARRTLLSLRFRHCRLQSAEESAFFWCAVSQCHSLKQLQYEPCRLDKWSREHIIDALHKKELTSLILTGIAGFQPVDVYRVTRSSSLTELAVVGENIKPSIYSDLRAKETLSGLNSLLIQVNSSFSLEDVSERTAILQMLLTMPSSGVLEVIHIKRGSVTETTKVISYWMHLARDSNRAVKLKLEECSQERQDTAVGRLLRKCRFAHKTEWSLKGLTLSLGGCGSLTLLDKHTWFGDEE
uniref:F-box domain-containing protein n=1 Tax=Heterorhabditis bacteriophora TaxID=37862 RepID=A0A1I7XK89_HETBA